MALYEGAAPSGISNSLLIINACLNGNILNRDNAPMYREHGLL